MELGLSWLVGLISNNRIPIGSVFSYSGFVSYDSLPVFAVVNWCEGLHSLEGFRLGLLEHSVIGVSEMHESNVMGSTHVVRRVDIVVASGVVLLHEVVSMSSFQSRVSSCNSEVLLRHLSTKFKEGSEDDHQD